MIRKIIKVLLGIVTVIVIGALIWSGITTFNKYQSAPYPYVYRNLQKESSCEIIRKDIDGSITHEVTVYDENNTEKKTYRVSKKYNGNLYDVYYGINTSNVKYYTSESSLGAYTLEISIYPKYDVKYRGVLKITYNDRFGYTTISHNGDVDKELYRLFLADLKDNMSKC